MPIKVLLVDDDPDFIEFASLGIQGLPVELHMAQDGVEGLEVFMRERPKVVVTDIMMPKMNGVDLVKKLKEIDPNLMIITVTGYPDYISKFEGLSKLIRMSLYKPLNLDDLVESVDLLVSNVKLKLDESGSD